ncbi:MAG TPA: GH92 family glycosyl hydrolase [Bacteroidota bacterium]|nr:GH92 family glycosyl hydrolase [Bacteroidota bacterium]
MVSMCSDLMIGCQRLSKDVVRVSIFIAFFVAGASAQTLTTYVDPFIGSEGEGHVFVGPSCPFGMVKPGPDCDLNANSGYVSDTLRPIFGFSQVHVSGTGGGPKYGNISVMPFNGDLDSLSQESPRTEETAHAGYYGVRLKRWNINVDLTASHSVAFHRYTFHAKSRHGIKIDGGFFLGEKPIPDSREAQQFVGSEIQILNDSTIAGYSRIRGGWNNGKAYTVYFQAVFDHPCTGYGTWKGKEICPRVKTQFDSGEKTGAFFYFDGAENEVIQMKIGVSFVSALKAAHSITEEAPRWNFDALLERTDSTWERLLRRIEIEASSDQKKMFYTALYHTMLMPVDRSGENPLWVSSEPYYDDFYAIWDIYRSSLPLITLIDPGRETDIVNALLNIYKHDGYMPDARSGNCNGRTQGGSNADVVIADAYVKGLKGIDYSLGLKALLKDATIPPGDNEEKEGRGGLADYNTIGYVSNRYARAGNRTVEYAYDDFCISEVAKGLGRMKEYQQYLKQSGNWQNLWRDVDDHGAHGFIMPKDVSGHWVDSIECDGQSGTYVRYTPLAQEWPKCVCWWCGFFYEGNSWEYSLFVPQDVQGLIVKTGGTDAFRSRLDTFFDNGYYNVSNEPDFLTPCLYHWVGRPDVSSQRIRSIIDTCYNSSRSGIPGNDDSGAMSSWLAFHMMGLYPNAGQPYYLITAPFFPRVALHEEEGGTFTIIARNLSEKNLFIQSATLNGRPFNQAWIGHREILEGGTLTLEMGARRSHWGETISPPNPE